jgi:uncharacterized repeat protein (TIGR03803 family)
MSAKRTFIRRGSRLINLLAVLTAVAAFCAASASAQTYTVIHQFTDGGDGGAPIAGLTVVTPGTKFYGSASDGGQAGGGTVFQLQLKNSSWILTPLYTFSFPNEDSIGPNSRVLVGPDGSLYGTTYSQGVVGCFGNFGCGLVYRLRPPLTVCTSALCYWTETVLYRFSGSADGAYPEGDLIFGQPGVLYGATYGGGNTGCQFGTEDDCGVVYSLTTAGVQSELYTFPGGASGSSPASGVIEDAAGNLYGTTSQGGGDGCSGQGCGIVYELSPNGSGWTQKVLYTFQGGTDGAAPMGGLIFDSAGNLYGTTSQGGADGGGTAFELTPAGGGRWTFNLLYSFNAPIQGHDFPGSHASLAMDAAGNLYGTTMYDGADSEGAVFKLTHSGGGWTYTSMHDFTGGIDGALPRSNVVFDDQGNMYGTASAAGTAEGVAWEITP